MNEKIKELELQCWEPTQYGPAWFNSTKFAESLIRKCADIADLADENKCEWIGGNILTHFGVSE
jgi:hypothetical protein